MLSPIFGNENDNKRLITCRLACESKAHSEKCRNYFYSRLSHLDFTPCLEDPRTWARMAIKSNRKE